MQKTLERAFVFIGRSGSGKGTQVSLLEKEIMNRFPEHPLRIYTSGDHFRSFVKSGVYSADLAKKINDTGGLQPSFLAVLFWSEEFSRMITGGDMLVIDGAPRTLHEAESLGSAFKFYGVESPDIIVINVSSEESTKRLMLRKRADDTEEAIKKRVEWYDRDVMPAVEFFRKNSYYNMHEINGEQLIENVSADIIESVFNSKNHA